MAEISPAIFEDEKQDRDGRGSAGNLPMVRGASRVRLWGAVNADGTPSGINGDYERTDELANERPVYVKVGKTSTSMWYYSVAAGRGSHQRQWVVGPTAKVGSEKMWAYSERPGTSQGPEIGQSDTWTVYCYQTQQWVRQSGVTVMDLEQRARKIEAAALLPTAGKGPAVSSGTESHLQAAGSRRPRHVLFVCVCLEMALTFGRLGCCRRRCDRRERTADRGRHGRSAKCSGDGEQRNGPRRGQGRAERS